VGQKKAAAVSTVPPNFLPTATSRPRVLELNVRTLGMNSNHPFLCQGRSERYFRALISIVTIGADGLIYDLDGHLFTRALIQKRHFLGRFGGRNFEKV
jgi:hypothetical protein